MGITPEDLNRLAYSPWKTKQDRLVILQTATLRNKRDFNAHRLLRAIDNNTLLSKLPASEEAKIYHRMLPKHGTYSYRNKEFIYAICLKD